MNVHRQCSWSDLPIDILASIIKLLEAPIDIIRVGGVCRSWRNSISYCCDYKKNILSPLKFPFIYQKKKIPFDVSVDKYLFNETCKSKFLLLYFHLTVTYLVKPICDDSSSPSNKFLIEVDHWNLKKHEARVLNIVSEKKSHDNTFFHRNYEIDSRNYHVSEICKKYTLKYMSGSSSDIIPFFYKKVILYPDNDREDCVVFAINRGELIYCKFGDWDWKTMNTNNWEFEDIILYNGKVYAVDRRSRLWVIGFSSSHYYMNSVCDQLIGQRLRRNRLVESCGDLYVLVSVLVHQETKIYKLKDYKYWDLVQSVNDRIFFIPASYTSYDSSFSISAKDYSELNGSLYFSV
ncbi:putative F-box protein At3g25750 [Mercurialis annua]|uniref:putative F-box protein At3g25750 n=1 Tax=Mercurialis annua TaxID=3986 RepID=UPI002160936D|nr:putative F-box protein At3g25750 [Mercurialis annua]